MHVRNLDINGKAVQFFDRGEQDYGIVAQTFIHKQFLLPSRANYMRKLYDEIVQRGEVPLVVDAGANIGAATVWFGENYPTCHIVSIEPDDENFRYLSANARNYSVDLRHGAIGDRPGRGALIDPGRGPLGYMTEVGDEFEVWSVLDIVAEKAALHMSPFIFKCDIEGGEANLFATHTDWVAEFPVIIAEPHDWMLPGSGSSQQLLRAISAHPRDFLFYGECIFSFRL